MASAYEWTNKLEKVVGNWENTLADGLQNSRELAVDLNQEQMLKGKNSFDNDIGQYHPLTKSYRRKLGRQTNYVDLYLTGRFQSHIYLQINGKKYGFDSDVEYTDDIADRYGNAIFGLTSESRRILWVEQLRKEVVNIINGY